MCEEGRGATRRRTLRSTRRRCCHVLNTHTHTQWQHTVSCFQAKLFKRFSLFVFVCLTDVSGWSSKATATVTVSSMAMAMSLDVDVDVSLSMLSITITGRNMRAHHANVKQKLKTATAAATSQRGNQARQQNKLTLRRQRRRRGQSERANEWQCKARRNTQPNTN